MTNKKNSSLFTKLISKTHKKWFTFIELMIAITIITFLSVLWFVSYKSHISSSRDATRKSELSDIYSLLDLQKTKSLLPIPDKRIDLYSSWIIIWYQWYLSKEIINKLWFKWSWKDPLDNIFYTYFLSKDLRNPWLMGFLENSPEDVSIHYLNTANAVDYSIRYPIIFWKKLWILVNENNIPIQEDPVIQSAWNIELWTLSNNYLAYFDNNTSISNSWYSMKVLYWTTTTWIIWNSCEQYIEEHNSEPLQSWLYLIDSWTWTYETYCDMSSTTWSWTETRIAICSWTVPSNAYAINWNTFIQAYNWIDWSPSSLNWNYLWTSCWFKCLDTHSWSWSISACLQIVSWVCWPDNARHLVNAPTQLCISWDPSVLSQPNPGSWPWTWTCNWRNWWTTANCSTSYWCKIWWRIPCIIP